MGITDALNEEDGKCWESGGSPAQGMEARISYRENFAFVAYPRRCIAGYAGNIRPRWVRLSAASEVGGYFDHWIAPNNRFWPNYQHAFYATPRLYAG